ncbi:MAG: bifunctional metallophosphatase/5'-nucleotidase [Betaproteobacteria bacterium]|nr:bifunctional metallophosphatase/5'-nucleotidase [Betaproteobacteria bacterium]NBX95677.1 bifunctional metallophosphatase/5'-nucleotidase [Betaproteobacteria bacterium]
MSTPNRRARHFGHGPGHRAWADPPHRFLNGLHPMIAPHLAHTPHAGARLSTEPAAHPAKRGAWRNHRGSRVVLRSAALTLALAAAGCALPLGPGSPTSKAAPPAGAAGETVHVRVIAFNDLHGYLESGNLTVNVADPSAGGTVMRVAVGGADAMAGLVQSLRRSAAHSLVVSSGDLIGATPLVSALFRHESTIEAANLIGVSVATAGNHEFDAGTPELLRILRGGCADQRADDPVRSCALGPYRGARFPMVSANVRRASGGTLLPPSWVMQAGPVKVGVIGAVTRVTPQLVVPSGVEGLQFTDEAQAINEAAQALQAQGVQALVVTLHEGAEIGAPGQPADWNDTTCPGLRGEAVDIIKRITPAVDLILTAHTHQGYNCRVDGRPVMQAVAYGRGLSVADLHIQVKSGDVDRAKTLARNLPVLNARTEAAHRDKILGAEPPVFSTALKDAQPDAEVAALVQRYAQAAAPQAQRVVGRIARTLDRRGIGDTPAGRLVAQAQWEATRSPANGGSHFALMNPGGIRTDLACRGTPPCEVTYGDLFSMQPFGNSLVVMSLSGAEVRQLLEQQQRGGPDAPLMSPSAGLTYRWSRKAPPGHRAQDIRIQGQALDEAATYRITVNSFMAEGGDGYTVLQRGRQRLGGAQDLDAMLAHLRQGVADAGPARITVGD